MRVDRHVREVAMKRWELVAWTAGLTLAAGPRAQARAQPQIALALPRHDDMRPATLKSLADAGAAAAQAALPAIRRHAVTGSG